LYFKDLGLNFYVHEAQNPGSKVSLVSEHPLQNGFEAERSLVIYQDSSGGKNWNSLNHVNREGKIPVFFKAMRCTGTDGVFIRAGGRLLLLQLQVRLALFGEGSGIFGRTFPRPWNTTLDVWL
jgi:hypothetical protein